MEILIIGLGIGEVYLEECLKRRYTVDTVDIQKKSTFSDISEIHRHYDLAIICTPNFTHLPIAEQLFDRCDNFLVEKPGFSSSDEWFIFEKKCISKGKGLYLAINNLYRDEIKSLSEIVNKKFLISSQFNWLNKNRIPSPGSWFTTKEKSYGGVSVDLFPHLLTFYFAIVDHPLVTYHIDKAQRYDLQDITTTDYGVVDKNGTYDVDDYCELRINRQNILSSYWKGEEDKQEIILKFKDSEIKYTFGLCPNDAYGRMVDSILTGDVDNHIKIQNKVLDYLDLIGDE